MASINKLSIRGVRAFSPDDVEQVIEFYYPVTVIVGSNGCGKTTIIESLKYAVTGSLPPGNKPGQAFVHDPKSIGHSVVKANIKLRFTNRAGTTMVVNRSMELKQNKSTMSFKALDGVLRTQDPNTGERMSMSHKCSELDRQIPTLMGVSKPILEHVVFCHQEDASWPLTESSALKKRFDDIFDSTRYAKALDAIRTTAKEYTSIAKELKTDLAGLKSHKHAAKGFEKELEHHQDDMEELETEIDSYNEEIKSLQEERQKLNEIVMKVEQANEDKAYKESDLEKEVALEEQQRDMLTTNYTETKDISQLQEMLSEFDDKIDEQIAKKQEMENQYKSLRQKIESYRNQEMSLRSSIGKLESEREQHDKMLRQRLNKMESIAQTYGIDLAVSQTQQSQSQNTQGGGMMNTQDTHTTLGMGGSTQASAVGGDGGDGTTILTIADEDMNIFLKALETKDDELKNELDTHRKQTQSTEDQIGVVLGDLYGKKRSIENDNERIQRERQKIRTEQESLSTGSSMGHGGRVRKSDVEESKRNALKVAKERDDMIKDKRRTEIPKEIRRCEEKTDKLKREIEDDNYVLSDLRKTAEQQNEIVVLREQATKEAESLQESVKDESYSFRKYNLPSPDSMAGIDNVDDYGEELGDEIRKLVDTVEERFTTLKDDVQKAADEQYSIQQSVSEKSALYSHNKRTLESLQARTAALNGSVKKYNKIITSICQFEDDYGIDTDIDANTKPQDLLKYIDDRITEITQEDSMSPEIVARFVKKLKKISKQLTKEKGATTCPCCRRTMGTDETQVLQDTLNEFEDEELSPFLSKKKNERNQQALEMYRKFKDGVSKCMHDLPEYERVKKEATDLDEQVRNMGEELHTQEGELGDIKSKKTDLDKDLTELQTFLQTTKRWAEDSGRLAEKRIQINQKQQFDMSMSMSAIDHGNRDLKTVERELGERMDEKDGLMNKVNRLNKELTQINDNIARITDKANKCDQVAKDTEARFESEQAATIRKAELNQTVMKLEDEEKKNHDSIVPLAQKIKTKEQERNRTRSVAETEHTRIQTSLHQFRDDVNKLKDLTSTIEGYTNSNKGDDLERLNSNIAKYTENVGKHENELKALEPELESLKKSVEDQESYKKNINDNIAVLKKQKEIAKLQDGLDKIHKELENIEGYDTCTRDLQRNGKRQRELTEMKANKSGRRGGILDQIRSLKKKLKTPEYKDIDERYRQTNIRYETTDLAVKDLDKYYSALDRALMRYHSIKIEEINKIIRELWTLTYKGQDITNIELESGNDGGSRTKRSYSYRVVMTKGTTKLDMRGRCSAGQRVLACLVIRLALAETFCLNCGVIALDEPTVNLDYANKRGLAISLAQIIAIRAKQNNFQLLVITHDEDFVSMMKRELVTHSGFDMPERYFQVSREEAADGKMYSKITSVDWDQIA